LALLPKCLIQLETKFGGGGIPSIGAKAQDFLMFFLLNQCLLICNAVVFLGCLVSSAITAAVSPQGYGKLGDLQLIENKVL